MSIWDSPTLEPTTGWTRPRDGSTRQPFTPVGADPIPGSSAAGLDLFRAQLAQWGLDQPSLIAWADEMLRSGASFDRILFEMESRPEFRAAFPEIDARRQRMEQTGVQLTPIGPGEILDYRVQAKALMRSFGLPESYWGNQSVLFNLVVNDKSLSELNDYLELTQRRVMNAPPQIAEVFGEVFGTAATQAMMLAFANDEFTLPALEDMVQTAEVGGAARRLGFDLSLPEMNRVADVNLSYDQLVSGFTTLEERSSLFDETISERTDLTVGREGIEAAFGLGGTGRAELERRGQSRRAETAGAGGELSENRGVTGLGSAGKL